jgi:hypothetical protein
MNEINMDENGKSQDMTEAPTDAPAGSVKVKETVKSNAVRTIIVASILSPQQDPTVDPSTGDPVDFFITYVTQDGQQITKSCLRDVWVWVEQAKPSYDVHADFILNIDSSDKVVGVVRKPHLRQGPLSPRLNVDRENLVLQKSGNVYEPVTLPYRFSTPVLQEAIEAITKAGNVKPGNKVGRFIVKQILSEVDGIDLVVLDMEESDKD